MKKLPATVLLALLAGCVVSQPDPTSLDHPDVQLDIADESFLKGEFEKAGKWYLKYLEEHPRSSRRAEIRLQYAKCLLGQEKWYEALQPLREVIDGAVEERTRIDAYYRRAIAYNALWDPLKALQDLLFVEGASLWMRGTVVRENELRFRLGCTRIRTGDWSGGRSDLERVSPEDKLGDDARIRATLDVFAIQVGACSDAASAERLKVRLASRGLDPRVHSSRDRYVVLVGAFVSFRKAQGEAERLARTVEGAFVLP